MKKMTLRLASFMLILVCLLSLVSCGKKKTLEQKIKDGDTINVAIIKYVSVPPLDDAERGIIEKLAEGGFVDGKNMKLTKYECRESSDLVNSSVKNAVEMNDMIFCIATPVATATISELNNRGLEIPTFFTAITDPVASGIVSSIKAPGGYVSGTSDLNQVEKQISILQELKPGSKKVGFIYSTDENNSVVQLNIAKAACQKYGYELISQACSNATDYPTSARALVNEGVDAIYLPTDNKLVSNIKSVLDVTNLAGVITIGGEESMIDLGATVTVGSVNYFELGKITGDMALKTMLDNVLAGSQEIRYYQSDDIYLNKTQANESNIAVPNALIEKAAKIK